MLLEHFPGAAEQAFPPAWKAAALSHGAAGFRELPGAEEEHLLRAEQDHRGQPALRERQALLHWLLPVLREPVQAAHPALLASLALPER